MGDFDTSTKADGLTVGLGNRESIFTGPKFGCVHHEIRHDIVFFTGFIYLGSEKKYFSIGSDGSDVFSDDGKHWKNGTFFPSFGVGGTEGHGTLDDAKAARDKYLGRTEYETQ